MKPEPWTPPTFTGEPRTVRLSPMRADTLECLCRGMNNALIAESLLINVETAKSHVWQVLQALGARDRLHAAVMALTGEVRIEVGNAQMGRRAA